MMQPISLKRLTAAMILKVRKYIQFLTTSHNYKMLFQYYCLDWAGPDTRVILGSIFCCKSQVIIVKCQVLYTLCNF